jgi:DNA-binding transcriptional LysR family regulator
VLFGRLYVLPIVTAFLAEYPEVSVRLVLSDRNLHLVEDHVDMAVRIGRLTDSRLVATRVGEVRHVVCASPRLIAEFGAPRTPVDLARMPAAAFDPTEALGAWTFPDSESGGLVQAAPRRRLSATTAEAAVWAAAQGVGVTRVLHYQCTEAVARGDLVLLLTDQEPEPLSVSLLHASPGAMPQKLRVFLDFAAPRLRRSLEALAATGKFSPDR